MYFTSYVRVNFKKKKTPPRKRRHHVWGRDVSAGRTGLDTAVHSNHTTMWGKKTPKNGGRKTTAVLWWAFLPGTRRTRSWSSRWCNRPRRPAATCPWLLGCTVSYLENGRTCGRRRTGRLAVAYGSLKTRRTRVRLGQPIRRGVIGRRRPLPPITQR